MAEGSRGPSVPFARLTGKEKKPSVFKMLSRTHALRAAQAAIAAARSRWRWR